jgi:hypothetical protein
MIRTLTLVALIATGLAVTSSTADAQIVVTTPGGYTYTPSTGVVQSNYYTPNYTYGNTGYVYPAGYSSGYVYPSSGYYNSGYTYPQYYGSNWNNAGWNTGYRPYYGSNYYGNNWYGNSWGGSYPGVTLGRTGITLGYGGAGGRRWR